MLLRNQVELETQLSHSNQECEEGLQVCEQLTASLESTRQAVLLRDERLAAAARRLEDVQSEHREALATLKEDHHRALDALAVANEDKRLEVERQLSQQHAGVLEQRVEELESAHAAELERAVSVATGKEVKRLWWCFWWCFWWWWWWWFSFARVVGVQGVHRIDGFCVMAHRTPVNDVYRPSSLDLSGSTQPTWRARNPKRRVLGSRSSES